MNRKELLELARSLGYKGAADLTALKTYLRENGYSDASIKVGAKDVPIDEAWNKTVTITVARDAGEDVQVKDASGGGEAPEAEGDEPEEPAESKTVADLRRRLKSAEEAARLGKTKNAAGKVIHPPAIRSDRERAIKAYNAKAAREGRAAGYGDAIKAGGTSFADGEIAEGFGAWWRLKMSASYPGQLGDYAKKASDIEIVKALGTTVNSLGGALIPDEYMAQLIELKERTGIMRGVFGFVPMTRDTLTVPRLGSDVSGAWLTENAAITDENKPTFDNVSLSAKKLGVLVRVSNELMHDSALNVGDIVARSMARRMGEMEDDAAVNGDGTATYGGIRGLLNKIDSNAYTTAAATTWATLTWSEILSARAKLSDIAGLGEPSFLCSSQFFFGYIHPLIHAAGGQTMQERIGGFSVMQAGGYQWITCPKMPQTLPASKIALYCGYFQAGAKFAEVRGATTMDSSDQRYFEYDQIAFRGIERVDINIHELGASGSTIVIAGLKTT